MNPDLLAFPPSLVGGHTRPRRLFTDPFSSPIPSWGEVLEADSAAVPMAPLRRNCSCFFDDGPCSQIREGDLADIRRKYAIPPLVGMRSPSESERAPVGEANEVDVYEAYLKVGFRGGIPSLIAECMRSCIPTTLPLWWTNKDSITSDPVTVLLWSECLQGVLGVIIPLGMVGTTGIIFVKIEEPFGYPTSWHTVVFGSAVTCIPSSVLYWRDSGESCDGSSPAIPVGDFSGMSAASSVTGLSPTSPAGDVAVSNHDSLVDVHRRLLGVLVFLRNQVRDVMARRDLSIQQARESARWELMREWLEKRVEHWNPKEEYHRYLFLSRGIGQKPGGPTQDFAEYDRFLPF
ncbi:hypothetical protein Bca101_074445 [Brassica carinata]